MPYPILGQRRATPPVPPSPLTLGAIEWHRADAVTFSGGPTAIQSWDDLSLNGRSVSLSGGNVNTRATQLPTSAPNGQPSASAPNPFAGQTTGYHGAFNYQLQDAGGGWSIFSVLKPDAAVDANAIYRFAYATADDTTTQFDGGNHWWSPFDSPGQLRASMTDGGLSYGGGDVVTAAGAWTYFLFSCDWGAGEIRVYRLGGLDQSAGVADVADRTLVSCYLLRGSRGGANASQFDSWFGELADLAVFPYALHSVVGSVDLLNQYAGDRYGAAMIVNA